LGLLAAVVACSAAARADDAAATVAEPAAHVADEGAPAAGGPLAPLEWLLGEWTGMTDNAVVLVSTHWCEDGAFIEREFVVQRTGQPDIGGTQRLGWDPVSGRIKCWTFDTHGGFGQGCWQRDGDSWVIESDETLADGSQSSTTAIVTPQGNDRFTWQIERARVNGVSLPQQKIEFVRAQQD
jgi:hypothetical protein